MARARMTHQKRQREVERREKAQEKVLKREARKNAPAAERGEWGDPDLAGIVAGPQPPRED